MRRRSRRVGHEAMIGRTVSHYRILSRLGAEGMGVVHRAEDTTWDSCWCLSARFS